jgi:mono/diheme cytochrome c family protein
MKKTITITVLALAVLACHRKTAAGPSAADKAAIEEKAKADAAAAAHAELVTQGKTVFTNNCGKCHGLKNTADYTPERWQNILKSMIPKAKLNDVQAQQVTAYVLDNAKK